MDIVSDIGQCWGCPVFDRLFRIISAAGSAVYERMSMWAWIVLVIFWAAFALWVVYQNMTDKSMKDPMYQNSVKPALINSLVVSVLLGMGIGFPKLVASVAFEPVAEVVTIYAESVLQTNPEAVAKRVPYRPAAMRDDGFFRPELRDKIITLMRTTVTEFQSMIVLGLAVMDYAFSLSGGIENLLKHILMFIMGAYVAYQFFLLFIRFCFYFVDVVVALAMFAFFFPFMLVFFVFKNSVMADWAMKKINASLSPAVFKNVINAIVGLAAAVITYTVVMAIIAKFFASDAMSSNEIVKNILAGTISKADFSNENLVNLTPASCIVIGFIINFLTGQIKDIGKEIFGMFGVSPESKMGEEIGKSVEQTVKNVVGGIAGKVKDVVVIGGEEKK